MSARIHKVLSFCDELNENIDTCEALMEAHWKSYSAFIGDVRLCTEVWHPIVTTWRLFEWGHTKWPNNVSLMLFYSRLVAIFPDQSARLIRNAEIIVTMPTHPSRLNYIIQYQNIILGRRINLTPLLKEKVLEVNEHIDQLKMTLLNFWEGVLQKDSARFWEDVSYFQRHLKIMRSDIMFLAETYPNNMTVLGTYADFMRYIARSPEQYIDALEKITLLETDGCATRDLGLELAIEVFPTLSTYVRSDLTGLRRTDAASMPEIPSDSEEDELQSDESSVGEAMTYLSDFLRGSPLGQIWHGSLIILVCTIFVCVFVGRLYSLFISRYVEDTMATNQFYFQLSMTQYEIAHLLLHIFLYPAFDTPGGIDSDSKLAVMAPLVYPDLLPEWKLTSTTIEQCIQSTQSSLNSMIARLAGLSYNLRQYIQTNAMWRDKSPQDNVMDLLVKIKSVLIHPRSMELLDLPVYEDVVESACGLMIQFGDVTGNLSDLIIESAKRSMSDLNTQLVLAGIVSLLFVCIPFMVVLFQKDHQEMSIAKCFSSFANEDIRAQINEITGTSSNSRDNTIMQIALQSGLHQRKVLTETILFLIAFIPSMICCLYIFYTARQFLNATDAPTRSINILVRTFSNEFSAISFLLADYLHWSKMSHDEIIEQATYFSLRGRNLKQSHSQTSTNMLKYHLTSPEMTFTFPDIFKIEEEDPPPLTTLEYLMAFSFPYSAELAFVKIAELCQTCVYDDNTFFPILYWYSNFTYYNRNIQFFDFVVNEISGEETGYGESAKNAMIIAIVVQVAVCFALIGYLFYKRSCIKDGIHMFMYLPTEIILKNSIAVGLLQKARFGNNETHHLNSMDILDKCMFSIVLIDRDGKVVDFNENAVKLLGNGLDALNVTDIFRQIENDVTLPTFTEIYRNVWSGANSPQFVHRLNALNPSGQEINIIVNGIGLTSTGIAHDGEAENLEVLTLVMENVTTIHEKEVELQENQRKIEKLMERVNPGFFVPKLCNLGSISFSIGAITVGHIKVTTDKEWDYTTPDVFNFYESVFTLFDEMMVKYSTLAKVRAIQDTYVFAGGLFETVTKPARSAEEAVRFAINIMKKENELSEALESQVSIKIGIDEGGPVIAGSLGFDHPWFQLIGEVGEIAAEMMRLAPNGKIQITRPVYELVFSAGFSIFDQGEIKIQGNTEGVRAYLVDS